MKFEQKEKWVSQKHIQYTVYSFSYETCESELQQQQIQHTTDQRQYKSKREEKETSYQVGIADGSKALQIIRESAIAEMGNG